MDGKQFKRTIEDFTCQACGAQVQGNGYTNHCPHCLWSKHVDVFPGDRRATCMGMMRPVSVFTDHGEYGIVHACVACGHEKKNMTGKQDSFEAILRISKQAME